MPNPDDNAGMKHKPTLFHLFHQYEPQIGLETLWFYKEYDPSGPDPEDDPNAVRLVGPTSPGECATVAKCIRLVLWHLGQEIAEEHGADD